MYRCVWLCVCVWLCIWVCDCVSVWLCFCVTLCVTVSVFERDCVYVCDCMDERLCLCVWLCICETVYVCDCVHDFMCNYVWLCVTLCVTVYVWLSVCEWVCVCVRVAVIVVTYMILETFDAVNILNIRLLPWNVPLRTGGFDSAELRFLPGNVCIVLSISPELTSPTPTYPMSAFNLSWRGGDVKFYHGNISRKLLCSRMTLLGWSLDSLSSTSDSVLEMIILLVSINQMLSLLSCI